MHSEILAKITGDNDMGYKISILLLLLASFSCLAMAEVNDVNELSITLRDFQVIQAKLKSDKPMTWIFTGDSITQGAYHTGGWRSYSELFAERIRWELRRKSDIVINTGISGDTAGKVLATFDWRVTRFQPDVVSIMIGTNDSVSGEKGRASCRKNLLKIVDKIRDAGAVPVINTPNFICVKGYNGSRKDLGNYVKIACEVAAEKKIILIDHWSYWQEQRKDKESLMNWLSDSIHPNEYGHRAIANKIFMELNIYDPNSPTCKLFIP